VQLTRRSATYEEEAEEEDWWPRWHEARWHSGWRDNWRRGRWDGWCSSARGWSEGGWQGGEERTKPLPFRLHLSHRNLDDEDIRRWCAEVGWRKLDKNQHQLLDAVDLSNNQLTDAGVDAFVDFLAEARKPTRRLKLYENGLREPLGLCRLIEDVNLGPGCKEGLRELHLSSNAITLQGIRRILDSLLHRRKQLEKAFEPPVWLRVERNEGSDEDTVMDLAKEFRAAGLGVCTEARGKGHGCTISWCRYGADVHINASTPRNTRRGAAEQGSSYW